MMIWELDLDGHKIKTKNAQIERQINLFIKEFFGDE